MPFFDKIKKKLRAKNIFWAVFSGLVTCALILLLPLFFSDDGTEYTIRFLVFDVPASNTFIIICCIFTIAALTFLCVSKIKAAIKSPEYHQMLEDAAKLGEVYEIDYELRLINPSPLTQGGELRYSPKVLFYMKDTEVTILNPAHIQSIETRLVQAKNHQECYVFVNVVGNDPLKIKTSKKNAAKLADDLRYTLKGI